MRLTALFPLAACCGGCDQHSQRTPVSIHEQREEVLNKIADKCGLARSTFKLVGNDELHILPDLKAPYERLDCALSELRKANLPVKMGFIGNEYYVGNEQ
jgi:hypothetical protein